MLKPAALWGEHELDTQGVFKGAIQHCLLTSISLSGVK